MGLWKSLCEKATCRLLNIIVKSKRFEGYPCANYSHSTFIAHSYSCTQISYSPTHIVAPSTTHTFTTFRTHGSCPPAQSHPHSLHIVLFVYAQHTVCQPILFYQHQCRSNYPPILYKRDIGKQSDVVTRGWVMLFSCSQYLGVGQPVLCRLKGDGSLSRHFFKYYDF